MVIRTFPTSLIAKEGFDIGINRDETRTVNLIKDRFSSMFVAVPHSEVLGQRETSQDIAHSLEIVFKQTRACSEHQTTSGHQYEHSGEFCFLSASFRRVKKFVMRYLALYPLAISFKDERVDNPLLAIFILASMTGVGVYGSHYYGSIVVPQSFHNSYLADTPDVAMTKSNYLADLTSKSHGQIYGESDGYNEDHSSSHGDFRYHGPTAIPHVLHDGHIADTHEVAAAKAEHFAAVAKAKANAGYRRDYNGRYAGAYEGHSGSYQGYSHRVAPYHGLLAKPVLLKSGYLADTNEVAAAKQHHLQYLHSRHNSYKH
ncbi:hypothetical protein J6590_000849 [Homalodisca vitripennis]|nr:hypothetical protein J6590_000849 [Homalodisca vitripennis]